MSIAVASVGSVVNGTGSSIATSAPSGVVSGNLLVLCVSLSPNATAATPSGWTAAGSQPSGVITGDSVRTAVWYRIATGGAADTPTVSLFSSAEYLAVILRVTGAKQSGVLQTSAFTSANGSATVTFPTVTAADHNLLINLSGVGSQAFTGSTPSGWTEQATGTGTSNRFKVWSRVVPVAGSYGGDTVSLSGTDAIASVLAAFKESDAQELDPTGYADADAFGLPSVFRSDLHPTALVDADAFGSPTLVTDTVLAATALADGDGFGTPLLRVTLTVATGAGIASTTAFGSPSVALHPFIQFAAIADGDTFGTPNLAQDRIFYPEQLTNVNGLGQSVIFNVGTVSPRGKATENAFGAPNLARTGGNLYPSGMQEDRAAYGNRFGNSAAIKLDGVAAVGDYHFYFLTGKRRRIRLHGTYSWTCRVEILPVVIPGSQPVFTVRINPQLRTGFDYQYATFGSQVANGLTVFAQPRVFNQNIGGTWYTILKNGQNVEVARIAAFSGTESLVYDFSDASDFEIWEDVEEYWRPINPDRRIYGEVGRPGGFRVIRVGATEQARVAFVTRNDYLLDFYYPYLEAVLSVSKNDTSSMSFSWAVDYDGFTKNTIPLSVSGPFGSASDGVLSATGDPGYWSGSTYGANGEATYGCRNFPGKNVTVKAGMLHWLGPIDDPINVTVKQTRNGFVSATGSGTGSVTLHTDWQHYSGGASTGRRPSGGLNRPDANTSVTHDSATEPLRVNGFYVEATDTASSLSGALAIAGPQVEQLALTKNQYRYLTRYPFQPLASSGRGWRAINTGVATVTQPATTPPVLRIVTGAHTAYPSPPSGAFYNMGAYLSDSDNGSVENRHVTIRIRHTSGGSGKRFRLTLGGPMTGYLSWESTTGDDDEWIERTFDVYEAGSAPYSLIEGAMTPPTLPVFTTQKPSLVAAEVLIDYLEANTTYEVEWVRGERTTEEDGATVTVERSFSGAVIRGQSETVPTDATFDATPDALLSGGNPSSWEFTDLRPASPGKPDFRDTVWPNGPTRVFLHESVLYESDLLGWHGYDLAMGGGRSRHGAIIDADVAGDTATLWAASSISEISFYPGAGDPLNAESAYSEDTTLEFSRAARFGLFGGVIGGATPEVVLLEKDFSSGAELGERGRGAVGDDEFYRTGAPFGRLFDASGNRAPHVAYLDPDDTTRRSVGGGGDREGTYGWALWRASGGRWLSADLSDTLRAGRAYVQSGKIFLAFATYPDGTGWASVNTGISGSEPCLRYQRGGREGKWILTYRDSSGNVKRRATITEGVDFDVAVTVFSGGYKFPAVAVTPTGVEHHFARRDSDGAIRGKVLDSQGNTAVAEFTAVSGSVDSDEITAYERAGYIFLLYRSGGTIRTVKSSDLTTFT